MVPMDVAVEQEEEEEMSIEGDQESRFFTCHVCGDNWLSVKMTGDDGDCQITFIHQMGMEPTLKRTAHVETEILLNEASVAQWDYFLGEDEVGEQEWLAQLTDRRAMLKCICSN